MNLNKIIDELEKELENKAMTLEEIDRAINSQLTWEECDHVNDLEDLAYYGYSIWDNWVISENEFTFSYEFWDTENEELLVLVVRFKVLDIILDSKKINDLSSETLAEVIWMYQV